MFKYLNEPVEDGDQVLGGHLLTQDDPQLVYAGGQGTAHLLEGITRVRRSSRGPKKVTKNGRKRLSCWD